MMTSRIQDEFVDKGSCMDLTSQNFKADLYYQKLLKECSLKQIMDKEYEVVRDAQTLHSDMQTLVYENYNKFILASETVKKMKNDFQKMEDEMQRLTSNMEAITSFSGQISSSLQETREKVADLSCKHDILKRLQFLFKLPNKLKVKIENHNYSEAVKDYKHAETVLQTYGHLESFKGIKEDSKQIVEELRQNLYNELKTMKPSGKELSSCIKLLIELNEPLETLSSVFLEYADVRLQAQLESLRGCCENTSNIHGNGNEGSQNIIEFIDMGSATFLSDLCITIASFNELFIAKPDSDGLEINAMDKRRKFVLKNIESYVNVMEIRIQNENDSSVELAKALDKFCRKLQATGVLVRDVNFVTMGHGFVINSVKKQCSWHLATMKDYFKEALNNVRLSLASSKPFSSIIKSDLKHDKTWDVTFSEFLTSLVSNVQEKLKGFLQDLMVFLQPEFIFACNSEFRKSFCIDFVREGLVVNFLEYLISNVKCYTDGNVPLSLLFILSKVCLQYHSTVIPHLLNLTDKWFHVDDFRSNSQLKTESELCSDAYKAAQLIIDHYVRMEGLSISQMLRKSVDTKDWLHSLEPRTVRAVMKRVVEELTAIDLQVGILFEEGGKTDGTSDSSRKTRNHRSVSNWSSYTPASSHSIAVINKLFSERVDIFAPVQFSKVSIMTGIIKISLKSLLECVRLKTFSRFGLQQVQVDTHYLQLYLWRFVHDENIVNFLLDDILGSTVHRCMDPVLMEPSVIDIICEKG